MFYLLWVYPLLLSASFTCIVMLNSWMFIHHTVKKQINLWTKMFLNYKSSFSVDTKVFIYLYMYYLSWYVFYINNIYMYILSLVLLINKYVYVSSICNFKSDAKFLLDWNWFQEYDMLLLMTIDMLFDLYMSLYVTIIDENWHVVWLVWKKDFKIFHIHIRIQTLVKNDKFSLLYDCDL